MEDEVIEMSVHLIAIPSYVKALKESSLKERSKIDYENAMHSKLYSIKGDTVLFRNYINDIEYWEYAFNRAEGIGKIKYLFIRYGCEE